MPLPIAYTIDDEPDTAGFFDSTLERELLRVTRQFCKNGVEWARARRYAFDEVCEGEWFEDLSEGDE